MGGSIHNTIALSPSDPLLGPDLLRFITTDNPEAIANIAFKQAWIGNSLTDFSLFSARSMVPGLEPISVGVVYFCNN
ncbi:MAG: hypothetical protein KFF72_06860 [Arthrospira sp. SH-MAG29]|nr:hypothetical protein [Arthrospira sp. SH-MAG29]MBS0016073.1 hypothetical protein [Arthrospira sp. SH-MAG29]